MLFMPKYKQEDVAGGEKMNTILIVDDEIEIAELISDALSDEGFDTHICTDGEEALNYIVDNKELSAIILDIMMPKMDGLTLCVKIRDKLKCPIIFVTAKGSTVDVLVGLEMGGDDYITKPFVVEELVAKVKAHVRRDSRAKKQESSNKISIGKFELYKDSYELKIGSESIKLSTREFQLLEFLMENSGKILSREDIFKNIWGSDYGDIGTVAVNIKNLRSKVDPKSMYIKTVWGYGYKFVAPSGDEDEI